MLPNQVCNVLRQVAGRDGFVALHEPRIGDHAWDYVRDCLATGWISTAGKYVDQFEIGLAEYVGVRRAVAMVNGTAALQIALQLAGVREGDEVICPALTFVATANAISYCRAVPHLVDIEASTLGVDPQLLDDHLRDLVVQKNGKPVNRLSGRPISAVVPVHTFGHPVNLDPLLDVCQRHRLTLVEDAAESLGSYYKGVHTGRFGKLAAMSFNGNKIISTGGGGALLTDDDALADRAKHLSTTAKVQHRWEYRHDELGFNYRMPNINAALGLAQLGEISAHLAAKRALHAQYVKRFADIDGIHVFSEPTFAQSNYWLNALVMEQGRAQMEQVLDATNEAGVMTRPAWELMSDLPMYENCPRMDLPVSRVMRDSLINIPSSSFLGEPYLTQGETVEKAA